MGTEMGVRSCAKQKNVLQLLAFCKGVSIWEQNSKKTGKLRGGKGQCQAHEQPLEMMGFKKPRERFLGQRGWMLQSSRGAPAVGERLWVPHMSTGMCERTVCSLHLFLPKAQDAEFPANGSETGNSNLSSARSDVHSWEFAICIIAGLGTSQRVPEDAAARVNEAARWRVCVYSSKSTIMVIIHFHKRQQWQNL